MFFNHKVRLHSQFSRICNEKGYVEKNDQVSWREHLKFSRMPSWTLESDIKWTLWKEHESCMQEGLIQWSFPKDGDCLLTEGNYLSSLGTSVTQRQPLDPQDIKMTEFVFTNSTAQNCYEKYKKPLQQKFFRKSFI